MHSGLPDGNLNERLLNVLGELAINRNLLYHPDCIPYITSLLKAGANPNVQNQGGKTLLHYVAESNDTNGIIFLLKAGANPNVLDQSGKTPLQYITEDECFQAIQPFLSGPESDHSSDNENQEILKPGNYHLKEDPKYNLDDSYKNAENQNDQAPSDDTEYGSDDNDKTVSDKASCDTEDKDSNSGSSDYLFLEDSLSMKLKIPLTTDEQKSIDKFCEGIRGITAQNKQRSEESILESIEKIVEDYLEEGVRLNSCCSCCGKTVTNLIFEEIEGVVDQLRVNPRSSTAIINTHYYTDESDGNEYKADEYEASDIIIKRITSNLLLKGGRGKEFFFGDTELANKHYDFDYLKNLDEQYQNRKEELKSIACEGIVGRKKQAQKEEPEKVEVDNGYFYVKYPQGSAIEPAKILNNEKAKGFNLKVSILQIGKNVVRVEKNEDGKRNYTDVLHGDIEMSFTTEVGEISIHLCPSKESNKKIEVKIDDENKAKFNKLKDKSSLGKNCLLEGESVSEVIGKSVERNDGVETTKDVSSALKQVRLPQKVRHKG